MYRLGRVAAMKTLVIVFLVYFSQSNGEGEQVPNIQKDTDGRVEGYRDAEETVVAGSIEQPPSSQEDMKRRAKEDIEVQRKIVMAGKPEPQKEKSEEEKLLEQEKEQYKLNLLTRQLDRNGDKVIDLDELRNWAYQGIRERGTLNEDSVRKLKGLFSASDHNPKDGLVSWREIVKAKHRYTLEEIELFRMDVENGLDINFVSEAVEMIDEEEKRFKAADEDEDGHLDITEMAAFLHPYDYPRMHELEVKRVMKEYDKTKNGGIELGEFYNDKDSKKSAAELKDLERQFKEFDKNGDGMLEEKEVRTWILPDTMEIARREARYMLEESDKNGDGVLSYKELLDNHNFWSGATGKQEHVSHYKDEL